AESREKMDKQLSAFCATTSTYNVGFGIHPRQDLHSQTSRPHRLFKNTVGEGYPDTLNKTRRLTCPTVQLHH
ncbi:MAG: hypothetical protein ACPIOQ_14680, partial [Promethearchaeia archaeon]